MDNKTVIRNTVTENSVLSFLIITPQNMKARVDGVHRKGVTENKVTQEGIPSMVHYGLLHVSG
jgi:hypothetical protein